MNIITLNKPMQSGGSGVKIHVVDTGCINLPYVTIAPFRGEPTPEGTWSVGNSIDYTPTREHGTMMCSIAHTGAPDAEIISCNAIPDKTISYLNEALAYIVEQVKADTAHRHIITMSLTCSGEGSTITTMHDLIQQLDALGALVVVAAGNDGHENLGLYPSAFEEPVTVSAVEADGTLAGFSTHHGEVDFCELGRNVPCLDMSKQSTTCDGTSPATQILGAKLAVMWSKNLTLTADEIYNQAKANVLDLGESGRDPYYGWGWIASVEVVGQGQEESNMLTASQLVAYFQYAVFDKWGYVWSLNGELYTREIAEKYDAEKHSTSEWRDPSTYWLKDCAQWIGKMAADCSGGIIGAIRTVDSSYSDRSANMLFSQCAETGTIDTLPEIPGLCLWRDGHIGIYEGDGCALEFRGTEYGAVRTKVKDRNFTHWGKLRDVKYEEVNTLAKVITIQDPITYDADVQKLQTALNALGYDCGTADGKAGKKTMDGIAAFCAAHSTAISLPDTLSLSVEIGGKTYSLGMTANT